MAYRKHDLCLIDVFLSITRYMAGDDPQPWGAGIEEIKILTRQAPEKPLEQAGAVPFAQEELI
jgi:hypothetical protein